MSTMDALIPPFESWQDGLLELADALGNAERIEVMVARLEATAQGGKHAGGRIVSWSDIVFVQTGLYSTLICLLEIADGG